MRLRYGEGRHCNRCLREKKAIPENFFSLGLQPTHSALSRARFFVKPLAALGTF
jgi:hypothetical protein